MKDIPKKIYLNVGFDKNVFDIKTLNSFNDLVDVGWSTNKINDQDIEFELSEPIKAKETSESQAIGKDEQEKKDCLTCKNKLIGHTDCLMCGENFENWSQSC